jgi:hypothetical protein
MRRTARAPTPLLCLIGRAGGDQTVVCNAGAASSRADTAAGVTGPSARDSRGEAE